MKLNTTTIGIPLAIVLLVGAAGAVMATSGDQTVPQAEAPAAASHRECAPPRLDFRTAHAALARAGSRPASFWRRPFGSALRESRACHSVRRKALSMSV